MMRLLTPRPVLSLIWALLPHCPPPRGLSFPIFTKEGFLPGASAFLSRETGPQPQALDEHQSEGKRRTGQLPINLILRPQAFLGPSAPRERAAKAPWVSRDRDDGQNSLSLWLAEGERRPSLHLLA